MTRRILPLLLALVLAGLGTAAVIAYVASADARALAGKKAVTVLVATQRIPAGTTAGQVRTGKFVEQIQVPAETVPKGSIGSVGAELDSLVITADILPRQMLFRGAFGPEKKTVVGLPVPEGKIAMSVQLTTVQGVAGYVIPGSKIAIFDTFNMLEGGDGQPSGDRLEQRHEYNRTTRILLPKVDVIAVGTFGVDGATDAPAPAADPGAKAEDSGEPLKQPTGLLTVTVAVTQAEAEKLVHGAQTGSLYLGLLNETSVVKPGPGVNNENLFK